MTGYAKYVETVIEQEPENRLLEARALYRKLNKQVPEMAYYKTLERMSRRGRLVHLTKGLYYRPKQSRFGTVPISERDIVSYYMENGQGMVIGYRLYNRKGLTTQISKRLEVLSSALEEQRKNINNVCITRCPIEFTSVIIPVIETLEILQHYKSIEDISKPALAHYMRNFAGTYSDPAAVYVLKNRRYKKSTIALLKSFLDYLRTENTLNQFLSTLSVYAIPGMEEFYESARK